MENTEAVLQHLERQLPAGLEMLRQMVGINSFTGNPAGVDQLGRFTAECFALLGFSAEFIACRLPLRGRHLVLTRPGRAAVNVAFISHLDTVFPPEEEVRNRFCWRRDGDRIFGPGTHDIKGGTVMMWLVLSALRERAPEWFDRVTWQLFWNASEEQFCPDFGEICRRRFTPHTLAALVFEAEGRCGEERRVVVARKGRVEWRATVAGRGAHAGNKHASGANAIIQLGQTVQQIAALTDYPGELTFNVGTICGGSGLNRVPHDAVAEGEFRAFSPELCAAGKDRLLALAGTGQVRSAADGFACDVQIQILNECAPWPRNPGTDELCQLWQETGAELGLKVGAEERGGVSDGNVLWDAAPTLDGLGPWGENDHCSEQSADGSKVPEFVLASSFVPKALLNVAAILKLIAGSRRRATEPLGMATGLDDQA